jgi:hypothetical protein
MAFEEIEKAYQETKNEGIPLNPNTSQMIPMTPEIMRGLKAKKDEDVRKFQVQSLVKHIYSQAIYMATNTTETSYTHEFFHTSNSPDICSQNTREVLLSLRDLFPGCTVYSSALAEDHEGKLHCTEENLYTFHTIKNYITIDWS